MALSTFVPSAGPMAGQTYTLPPVKGSYKRAAHVNRLQNAFQEIEEATGVYISSGSNPLFPSFGEVQAVFTFLPGWLQAQGYKPSQGGLIAATFDFAQYVLAGGLGTLTDTLPSDATAGKGGAALTSRSCQALVNGDYNPEDMAGAAIEELTVTFMVPSCVWTYSPGGIVLPFH